MAETLGSLCDKLSIVKLKQWHSEDPQCLASLTEQERRLTEEVDRFVSAALNGHVPFAHLTFAANKIYQQKGNEVPEVSGGIGAIFAQLAHVNCELWHEQEKVYEFEQIPVESKDKVVKHLALLNLQRNKCIDMIDMRFQSLVAQT